MPSPKEILLANGLIEGIGRGRISKANHEWLTDYAAKGGAVDGYQTVVVKNNDGSDRIKNTAAVSNEKVIADLVYRYKESDWQAVEADGTVRGMREVCQPCGYSLLGHQCDAPVIVAINAKGSTPVTIVPKRK